jgi:hypothetical protein
MRKILRWCFVAAATTLFALPGLGQEKDESEKPWWGLDVGVYFPTDGEIQDRFGNAFLRFGIRPFETKRLGKWRVITDATVLAASKDGSRLLAIPVTIGVLSTFGKPDTYPLTFVTAGAGPAYYNYAIDRLSDDQLSVNRISFSGFGFNAHAELGVMLQERLSVTGRYDWFSASNDFDFSGFSLTVAFAVFRW